MSKQKFDKVFINTAILPKGKNLTGILGEKCNNCGGYGYTVGLKGTSINCKDCEGTGVKSPTIRELQNQISDVKKDLDNLRRAIMKTLGIREIDSDKMDKSQYI